MDGTSENAQPGDRSSRSLILRREVELPVRQSAGLGVMLVASAAMFFAVASSAFILRAQMPREHCFHESRRGPVAAPVSEPPTEDCGEAVYTNAPDGKVYLVYELCPDKKK